MNVTRISKPMKGLLAILSATVLIPVSTASPVHAAYSVVSNWSNSIQLKSNWCWAADDYAILAHYGYWGQTQSDIVNYVFGTTTAPNNTATGTQAQNALYHYGVSTNSFNGALFFSDIQAQINGNKPIFSGWNWKTGGSHAVVLIGWSTETSTDQVRYMDPGDGNAYWTSHVSFVDDSRHSWIGGLKDAWAYK
ncbi:hypothetical protein JJB07_13060 [Tumebacillus sp. ITR2]|uniref:Peptidase C39-like domain-containing protein n=1 Tax=Tumebacillus amylolyticus TaxID=2801339 RepID=A0ABS1JBE4_9BACL|nr:papain-like cysteine protease family protein [Tumebacillus amylolyticus]MBL0387569.1 hypothetical protein [Tumebacillus amylolyticus]